MQIKQLFRFFRSRLKDSVLIENELKDFQYLSDSSQSFLDKIKDFQTILENRFTVEKRNSFSTELRVKFQRASQELESLERFIQENQISLYQNRIKQLEDEIQLIQSLESND